MPQSRRRKTTKAKKRPKGTYITAPASGTHRKRAVRATVVVIIAALALSAVALVVWSGRTGEVSTASGLKYTDLVEGTGATPKRGQTVVVHYTGTLENGTKFDSSLDRNVPAEYRIGVGEMIKGWDEGLMSMKVGGKRRLVIPPYLGYGAQGRAPDIPSNATLIFDVELLDVR